MVIAAPGVTRPGSVTGRTVSFVDLYPTISDLCGVSVRKELEGKTLKLSAIFSWFGGDFGEDEAGRLEWIAGAVASERPELAEALRAGGLEVESLDWDWSINSQGGAAGD